MFAEQIKAFETKANRRMAKVVYSVVVRSMYSVLDSSPWGDWPEWSQYWQYQRPIDPEAAEAMGVEPYEPGRFRGNWDYGWNEPPPPQEFDTVDATSAVSQMRIMREMGPWTVQRAAAVHYLVNNLSYAKQMESGESLVGHNLALGRMLELTAQKFDTIVLGALAQNVD